jgi:hypothetical protein
MTPGSIIDVGGIQLMYEAPGSMLGTAALSPARVIRAFTALRPQCPVQLHTMR